MKPIMLGMMLMIISIEVKPQAIITVKTAESHYKNVTRVHSVYGAKFVSDDKVLDMRTFYLTEAVIYEKYLVVPKKGIFLSDNKLQLVNKYGLLVNFELNKERSTKDWLVLNCVDCIFKVDIRADENWPIKLSVTKELVLYDRYDRTSGKNKKSFVVLDKTLFEKLIKP